MRVDMLRQKIKDSGKTSDEIAAEIGINRSTYFRKMAENGEKFSIQEVRRLVKALGISYEDAIRIFLQ